MPRMTLTTLQKAKAEGRPFSMLTAYDATFARTMEMAGIDVLLVGDSLGMVSQGHASTVPVTLDDMAYHTAAVARGTEKAIIVGDLPYMTYANIDEATRNATRLMQAGANMVKMEGGIWLADTVRHLAERGVPVCGHVGLTPQSADALGGYRVQGKTPEDAAKILADAKALDEAGAALLVVECVPSALGKQLAESVAMPVIGIGAGPDTDGQVLVMHDMLGLGDGPRPRFAKNYMDQANTIPDAFAAYAEEVRARSYPAPEHCY